MSRFNNALKDIFINRTPQSEKVDVIIFGASGQVGRRTVLEAVDILKNMRWGIAGRNRQKLKEVLKDVSSKTQADLSNIPIWVTKINDWYSIRAMAKKCRILINCCGPYLLYGEPIVKACISSGTHYVDLCAEPLFLEIMHMKYNEQARKNNVYIVCACGFFGLAADIGVNYVREVFEGTLYKIDAYTEFGVADAESYGAIASASFWASIVLSCANLSDIPLLIKKIVSQALPDLCSSFRKGVILQDPQLNPGSSVPFPLLEANVVDRSQCHFYQQYNIRPIEFNSYISFPSALYALIFCIWISVIAFLAQFERTRDLLLRYPKIFSLGLFSCEGPLEEKLEKTFFRITFYALGWPKSNTTRLQQLEEIPEKRLKARVSGENPLYGVSCIAALNSAFIILEQSDSLPKGGGVYSPGAAFATTDLILYLKNNEHGMKFFYKPEINT